MGKITQNMSSRDKARWISLLVGGLFMGVGVAFPVPLNIMGKPVTDNAFLVVGAIGAVIAFGVIQAVKAVKGSGEK